MSRDEALLSDLLAELARRPRPVRVVPKRGVWHQTVAHWLLRVVTLGGQDRYLSDYVTTLGATIYVPHGWDDTPALDRYTVLRHEAVHVAQFDRYGWLGMVLLYGLLPFPVGLAYGRARLEWEAYAESLRAVAAVRGLAAARDPGLHQGIVRRFTGPDYAWMWPFPRQVQAWIDAELAAIEARSPP